MHFQFFMTNMSENFKNIPILPSFENTKKKIC